MGKPKSFYRMEKLVREEKRKEEQGKVKEYAMGRRVKKATENVQISCESGDRVNPLTSVKGQNKDGGDSMVRDSGKLVPNFIFSNLNIDLGKNIYKNGVQISGGGNVDNMAAETSMPRCNSKIVGIGTNQSGLKASGGVVGTTSVIQQPNRIVDGENMAASVGGPTPNLVIGGSKANCGGMEACGVMAATVEGNLKISEIVGKKCPASNIVSPTIIFDLSKFGHKDGVALEGSGDNNTSKQNHVASENGASVAACNIELAGKVSLNPCGVSSLNSVTLGSLDTNMVDGGGSIAIGVCDKNKGHEPTSKRDRGDKVLEDLSERTLGPMDTNLDVGVGSKSKGECYAVKGGLKGTNLDVGDGSKFKGGCNSTLKGGQIPKAKTVDGGVSRANGVSTSKPMYNSLFKPRYGDTHGFDLEVIPFKEAKIVVTMEDLEDVHQAFGYPVVGYVAGERRSKGDIIKCCNAWKVKFQAHFEINNWVVIIFDNEVDKNKVLGEGPYSIFGSSLILKDMPPFFNFEEDSSSICPLWVRLPNLPFELWSKRILSMAAMRLGNPLRADLFTRTKTKISFARVFVEVDLSKELVEDLEIELPNGYSHVQKVVYESIPDFCKTCKRIGHVDAKCVKNKPKTQPVSGGGRGRVPPIAKNVGGPSKNYVAAKEGVGVTSGGGGVVKLGSVGGVWRQVSKGKFVVVEDPIDLLDTDIAPEGSKVADGGGNGNGVVPNVIGVDVVVPIVDGDTDQTPVSIVPCVVVVEGSDIGGGSEPIPENVDQQEEVMDTEIVGGLHAESIGVTNAEMVGVLGARKDVVLVDGLGLVDRPKNDAVRSRKTSRSKSRAKGGERRKRSPSKAKEARDVVEGVDGDAEGVVRRSRSRSKAELECDALCHLYSKPVVGVEVDPNDRGSVMIGGNSLISSDGDGSKGSLTLSKTKRKRVREKQRQDALKYGAFDKKIGCRPGEVESDGSDIKSKYVNGKGDNSPPFHQ